jgi:hypothetical protein
LELEKNTANISKIKELNESVINKESGNTLKNSLLYGDK